MKISSLNFNSTFVSNLPKINSTKIVKAAQKAMPMILLTAAAINLPQADACRYTECFEACSRADMHELAKLICMTWCAIFCKD